MNIEVIEYKTTDTIMCSHNIETMPPEEVDAYCDKIMKKLKGLFGATPIILFPVREGPTWDFKLIRQS